MPEHSSSRLRARQELVSAQNGIAQISMGLICEDPLFPGHLISAAERFETVAERLREIAAQATQKGSDND